MQRKKNKASSVISQTKLNSSNEEIIRCENQPARERFPIEIVEILEKVEIT